MRRYITLGILVAASLVGCNEPTGGYEAASAISRDGFARNREAMRAADRRPVLEQRRSAPRDLALRSEGRVDAASHERPSRKTAALFRVPAIVLRTGIVGVTDEA
jgi:hypothetical protein